MLTMGRPLFPADLNGHWKTSYLSSYFTVSLSLFFLGLQHQGIFRVSGSQVEVNDIKNSFERGRCLCAFKW